MTRALMATYAASGVKWAVVLAFGFPLWVAVALSVLSKLGLLALDRRRAKGPGRANRRGLTLVVRFLWAAYWTALLALTATDPSGQELGGVAVWIFLIAGGAFAIGSVGWIFDHHFEIRRRPELVPVRVRR